MQNATHSLSEVKKSFTTVFRVLQNLFFFVKKKNQGVCPLFGNFTKKTGVLDFFQPK
jgi:hypothetical protein